MELQEFIKTTLISIRNGVHLANEELLKNKEGNRIYGLRSPNES